MAHQSYGHRTGLSPFAFCRAVTLTSTVSFQIFTTKHSFVRNGILPHSHLVQLWRPPSFPSELHPFLFKLFNQFNIAITLTLKVSSALLSWPVFIFVFSTQSTLRSRPTKPPAGLNG